MQLYIDTDPAGLTENYVDDIYTQALIGSPVVVTDATYDALDAVSGDIAAKFNAVSVSSSLVILETDIQSGGVPVATVEIHTDNLSNVGSVQDLLDALDDQTATGDLEYISVTDADGEEALRVNLAGTGGAGSGVEFLIADQTILLSFGVPATLQGIFALAGALDAIADPAVYDALSPAEKDDIDDVLADVDLEGFSLTVGDDTIYDISISSTEASIVIGDFTLTMTGDDIPLTSLLDIFQLDRGTLFSSLDELLTETGLESITITGVDDEIVFSVALEPGDNAAVLENLNLFIGDPDVPDNFVGTADDDYFNTSGDGESNYESVEGSLGNDTVNYGNSGADDFQQLIYAGQPYSIEFDLDTATGAASVTKSVGGVDTIQNIQTPLTAGWATATGGFGLRATSRDDTFDVNLTTASWMQIESLSGDDTLNLNLNNGTIRLRYDNVQSPPENGIDVDLSRNIANDDGYGDTDVLNITGTAYGNLEIHATQFADTIIGSNVVTERYILGGGNDTLNAGGGHDILRYDRSDIDGIEVDVEAGTASGVWIDFMDRFLPRSSFVDTFSGVEEVRGSNSADELSGGLGRQTLRGREGDDEIIGGGGSDLLFGDGGDDTIDAGRGLDTVYGGAGDDMLIAGVGAQIFAGGLGDDVIDYSDSSDGVTLNLVTDAVSGGWADNDTISDIEGAIGSDGGNDSIIGTSGDNLILTRAGDDRVRTLGGDDRVYLGAGNDYVQVGSGANSLFGGSGTDYLSYFTSTEGVSVNLALDLISGGLGDDDTIDGFEGITASRYGDDTIVGTDGENLIRTYGGDDRVFTADGDDQILLGSGDDYVRVGDGANTLEGGSGDDYLSYFDSTAGLRVDLQRDEISGGYGADDTIEDFEGITASGTGNDTILGTTGDNLIRTYGGDDRIYSRAGDDTILAGSGDDTIAAAAGDDVITGGSGADVFHFDLGAESDVILDFENNIDTIELDDFTFGTGETAFDFANEVGSDVVFTFDSGDVLTVENATISQLLNDLEMV